jgi:hypothetical protein
MWKSVSCCLFLAVVLPFAPTARAQSGTITGVVRNAKGLPSAGVRVMAFSEPGAGAASSGKSLALVSAATTDATGRYQITGVPPGRHLVAVGPLDDLVFYPGSPEQSKAIAVVASPGLTLSNIDFVFVEVRVRGRIEGSVAADIFHLRLRKSNVQGVVGQVIARPDGGFELSRIRPGVYTLAILQRGVRELWSTRIEVGNDDIDGLLLQAPPLPVLVGQVELENAGALSMPYGGLAGSARLLKISANGPGRLISSEMNESIADVGPDGRFVVALAAGAHTLDISQLPMGYDIDAMSYGDQNLLIQPLVMPASLTGSEPEIRIKLKPMHTGVKVTGRVVGLGGAPAALRVILESLRSMDNRTQRRAAEVALAGDGTFEFTNVSWGSYVILLGDSRSSVGAVNIAVTDRDVKDVEVRGDTLTPQPLIRVISPSPQLRDSPITPVIPTKRN